MLQHPCLISLSCSQARSCFRAETATLKSHQHGAEVQSLCLPVLSKAWYVWRPVAQRWVAALMQVSKEVEEHGDIVLVREKTNYKSILLKTFFVLEYAIKHYDVRYILKTDDDAYVHVEALVHQLKLLCISPDCR